MSEPEDQRDAHVELTDHALKRLLRERSIFLNGPIDDEVAARVCAQIMLLDAEADREIALYINSPGGVVTAGFAIYDTMRFVTSPVRTVCLGTARSMGSLLVTAGDRGRRVAFPNAGFLVHQPSGGYQGSVVELERHARDIVATKQRMIRLYADCTGQSPEEVARMLDRDTYLTAEEARDWGLIDHVVETRAQLRALGVSEDRAAT